MIIFYIVITGHDKQGYTESTSRQFVKKQPVVTRIGMGDRVTGLNNERNRWTIFQRIHNNRKLVRLPLNVPNHGEGKPFPRFRPWSK